MKLFVNEERPIKRLRACDGTLDCDDVGCGAEEVNQQPFSRHCACNSCILVYSLLLTLFSIKFAAGNNL